MKKGKIVIVEGKSDTNRLKLLDPSIITFETSGLGLDEDKIQELKRLNNDYELIVFTDPDGPGERIRKKINDAIPGVSNAFLPSKKALSKDNLKVGVEHANINDIKEALANVYTYSSNNQHYEISDLINWNIYANKQKRMQFCELINISFGNNQKIIKQLNGFNIDISTIEKALKEMENINE